MLDTHQVTDFKAYGVRSIQRNNVGVMIPSAVDCPCNCLAVYGSLQPGGPNEHVLSQFPGTWERGFVRGILEDSGWGAKVGYPGIRLTADGKQVEVQLFRSEALSAFWPNLDSFEGVEYQRLRCEVQTAEGTIEACIYALR